MVALNLTQEKKAERSNLNFKFISADKLTDIIQSTTKCRDIIIGGPAHRPEYGFLSYPVPWCQHIEKLTGMKKDKEILPIYLALVMHVNTHLFNNELVPNVGEIMQ